jgi:prepilin-type N-terminal cleavage/methylation domain-containing protein
VSRRGFSLIEVLVALTIIGLGFSVIYSGMSGSVRNLDRAQATDHRVELAREKLTELDLLKAIRPGDSTSGVFADGTRWTVQTSPFIPAVKDGPKANPASVIQIDFTVEWNGRNGVQKQTIQKYRYQVDNGTRIPSLEEQLRELQ